MYKSLAVNVFVALALATSAYSAPVVTGASGTISNGGSVNITGNGFGTKPTAAPVLWDNFEDGTNGQLVQATAAKWDRVRSDNTSGPRYSAGAINASMGVRTGSGAGGGNTRALIEDDQFRQLYMDYYIRAVKGVGLKQRSSKQVMIWSWGGPGIDDGPNTVFWQITQGGEEPPFAFSEYSCGSDPFSITYNNGWGVDEFTTARHVQIEFRLPTNVVGAADYHGTLKIWYDGVIVSNRTPFGSYSCDPNVNFLDNLYIGHYQDVDSAIEPQWKWHSCPDPGCDCTNGASGCSYDNPNWLPARQDEFFYDNIYLDKSIARVELGNASTYESCTRRDVQPASVWTNGSITIPSFNQGAFPTGAAYLFVVDANGNASAGFPVTIAGGAGGNNTIPAAPQNLQLQ